MSDLAITTCRVSSTEQLENNSLTRQQEAVLKCAKELGVIIPHDGQWSGSVSSKRGDNVKRKDLQEMLTYCKKHPRVKYLIIDEPDRFMRSIEEAFHFEVEFKKLGVQVWYASDKQLNSGDLMAKMMRFMKYFSAEGSNEERITKSISGGQMAIREGRLPSSPKVGYRKGTVAGIHVINPTLAVPLQKVLRKLASRLIAPTDALKELNASEFGKHYTKFKMDRFRQVACEPYYAGIIDLKGKFNLRNEKGLHEPLITKEEHEQILRVFNRNPKNQSGHRKNKNEVYPLSNKITCDKCDSLDKKYPRFTSCPISNGKNRKTTKFYEKYRCRGCNRYLDKAETHERFSVLLNTTLFPENKIEKLKQKLVKTFNAKHLDKRSEIQRLEAINTSLIKKIENQVDAVIDPKNAFIKDEIANSIKRLKKEHQDNEGQIAVLRNQNDNDLKEFLDFAFGFLDDKGKHFFDLTEEDTKRCKQLVFPAQIYVDEKKNVYTNEVSAIFRGKDIERDTEVSLKSNLVRVQGL